jgi:hypothetical protein
MPQEFRQAMAGGTVAILPTALRPSSFSSQASDRRWGSVLDRIGLGEQDVAQVAAIDLAG